METSALSVPAPILDLPTLESIINRVFVIEDITQGKNPQEYLVRYRGLLRTTDSIGAYDQLTRDLAPLNLMPLFRKEERRHSILLIPARPKPKPSNPWVNLLMLLLTVLSVSLVGGYSNPPADLPADIPGMLVGLFIAGFPFALALMGILLAHEFGHYLAGRAHGVAVSLPYFIPFPLPPFGTMGAFINMKESPRNRRYLLDIGLAGPLAGAIVAIPVLLFGLSLSTVQPLPLHLTPGTMTMEGNSLIYLFLKWVTFGRLLPAPITYANTSPILYWLKFFFTGRPFPLGGSDVMISPIAMAGWGGLLVTSLNLIPAGQFDGGHLMYVLFGRKVMQRILPFILVALAVLGFFWSGWWLWIVLIFFLGRVYAEPLDQITELDPKRRALAIVGIILLILVFTPIPMNVF